MSGGEFVTGWAVAFCYWDEEGKRLARIPAEKTLEPGERDDGESLGNLDKKDEEICEHPECSPSEYLSSLPGNEEFGRLDVSDIPAGFVTVPVKIDDNGHEIEAEMLAGSIGLSCLSNYLLETTKPGAGEAIGSKSDDVLDTLQPQLGWFMYEVFPPEGPWLEY